MLKNRLIFFLFYLIVSYSISQENSNYIVVDQFGYRPDATEKIAVIRNPLTGYDSNETFTPGETYALVDAETGSQVFSASPIQWNSGAEDASSGDQTWWFDFSSVTNEGEYYVLDITNNVKSYDFEIRSDIYNDVLKHAVRTFYYQRVGFAKEAPYADEGWTDGASHLGSLQDTECRSYDDSNNSETEKDLRGGWYDAGDYNKYTPWTSNYVYGMLQAYEEAPYAWSDDYNLPESGNGIADILDEAKWGMDHLLRLQNEDGSLVSVVAESHASPPSSATGKSLYGAVNTTSTLAAASAFAYGAKIYNRIGLFAYANTLQSAAEKAWDWAIENPNVIWKNNDSAYNSTGIGAGQQETDDYGRLGYKMRAAAHLYEQTQEDVYKTFFENNYTDIHLISWTYAYPFEVREQDLLLYYTSINGISSSVKSNIIDKYTSAMNKEHNFSAIDSETDAYLAYLKDYGWGSNGTKAQKGNMFYGIISYDVNSSDSLEALKASERYVHYMHGVNPLNIVYLTNMNEHGAENSASQIYHTWFADGSSQWDETGVSTYGPAPGFVPGGPNPSYDVDACCSSSCGGNNTSKCTEFSLNPPKGQPDQKSYLNFNDNWPLNSWSVTENSCGYQLYYIRLLSKFIQKNDRLVSIKEELSTSSLVKVFPNPSKGEITIENKYPDNTKYTIQDLKGAQMASGSLTKGMNRLDLQHLEKGIYLVLINDFRTKIIID